MNDDTFRSDDLEFAFAARVSGRLTPETKTLCFPLRHPSYPLYILIIHWSQAWSDCVSFGDFDSYRDRFETIQQYFAPRFPEAVRLGNEMMKTILAKTEHSKEQEES